MIVLAIFYASMHTQPPIVLKADAIRRAVYTTSQRVNIAKNPIGPKI